MLLVYLLLDGTILLTILPTRQKAVSTYGGVEGGQNSQVLNSRLGAWRRRAE